MNNLYSIINDLASFILQCTCIEIVKRKWKLKLFLEYKLNEGFRIRLWHVKVDSLNII